MIWMLVREDNLNWIIVRRGFALSDSAIAPQTLDPGAEMEICFFFFLEVGAASHASALGSPAFLCGSWARQLGMRADALPGPNPACMAVRGIDCHRPRVRSGLGINRSSLRIRLHATFAERVPSPLWSFLKLFSVLFCFLARTKGNRIDILLSGHVTWFVLGDHTRW